MDLEPTVATDDLSVVFIKFEKIAGKPTFDFFYDSHRRKKVRGWRLGW